MSNLPDTWKEYPLSDLYDFRSGLSKPRSEFGYGYGFLSFKDVFYNFFVPDKLGELVNSTDKERKLCSIKKGDVFLTRTSETMDELGMSCFALKDYEGATFNGFTKRLRPKTNIQIIPEYAGYFFRSPKFRNEVTAMSSLCTRASLNNEMLGRLKIILPSIEEQIVIGCILKSLDDKIELNQQMNQTLEAMARAIFKSWFVDFDPVRAKMEGKQPVGMDTATANLFGDSFEESELGLIPKGWKVGTLSEACQNIYSGGTPSTKNLDYWNGNIPWLSSGETRSKFIDITEKTITSLGVEKSSTRLAKSGCVVIASAGQGNTRGQTSLLMIDSYINQSVIALKANPDIISELYLFFNLSRRYEEFRQISDSHSSRGSLTTKLLAPLDILIPSIKLISVFDFIVQPMINKICQNLLESRTLANIRDTLLPKLMSGEIRVKEAETMIEEVA